MTDTTFVDQQTIIQAAWCNDINDHVYNDTPISPSTTVHDSSKISNSIKRVANIAAIRSITPVSTYDVETQGYYTSGDGGHGTYYGVTGAAAGTYVDNGGTIIVPTGGDGSSCWKLKVIDAINVKQFGAKGDGSFDDTAYIQAAITASPAWSNVALAAGGAQSVGGALVVFPPTTAGYKITSNINITNTKITLRGPAKLIISAGVTAFAFQYAGSTSHTGCIIDSLDFTGGAIGVDVGDQAVAIPVAIYNCMFVNQTTAGAKIGQFGYGITIRDNLFTGCNYGVWSMGQAADSLLIDHNVFIYNTNYDIYIQNNNTYRITNNDFVQNQKTPASTAANVYVDTAAGNEVGGYSVIGSNKFGQEGRTAGNCIVFAGTAGELVDVDIVYNMFHYLSQASTNYAIKVGAKNLNGINIENNSLILCSLVDYSSMLTSGFSKDNSTGKNVVISGARTPQLLRGNNEVIDQIEPPSWQKFNILAWSRYINSGVDFTYSNATPSYMTAIDENGIANNATTVTATAANNVIRINVADTNNQQMFYTFSLWLKLGVAGSVSVSASRGTDYAFNQTISVGTSWQRITIPFYQTYFAAGSPYSIDLTIPNGGTVTLGGVCCVPGRDVGDLFKSSQVVEKFGIGMFASASPSIAMYLPAGTVVKNSAPSVGQPKGWVCTVSGTPGTWVSEGNL